MAGTADKLGIVAGGGGLPKLVVAACLRDGRPFHLFALTGNADPELVEGQPHDWIRLGGIGHALDCARRAGTGTLVFAGRVRRPSLAEIRPDWKGAQYLARLAPRLLGDDAATRVIIEEVEKAGFSVVAVPDVLGDCLTVAGPYGKAVPTAEHWTDIERGIEVARLLGAADVGQSVVVQQGLVLGVEAIEGTDQLLARCADLRRPGRGGVLVKASKPGQERRIDLPVIGPDTVAAATAAGLVGIAIQAGGAILIEPEQMAKDADFAGLFIIGFENRDA